ncbi:MAG: phosphoadenylyl-sulfate reductase [Bacteroidales bacterium]|nr:phosphoadenylyl-sulfate reductase [Bacteroidales bacterium]
MNEKIDQLNRRFAGAAPSEILSWSATEYSGKITFSSSLGAEDQAITHILAMNNLDIPVFTLDTGRIFQETFDLLHVTEEKYRIRIAVYFPDASRVEKMVGQNGINLFYDSVENRKLCCQIRKIEPLKRALHGMSVWVTGLRREQSVTRKGTGLIEWDPVHRLIKVNPLLNWTHDVLWEYIRKNNIPVNELHRKGYPSIGCIPCTRAIGPGEDTRAGRWWWELSQLKECGLHPYKK